MKTLLFFIFLSSTLLANSSQFFGVPPHQQRNIEKLILKLGYEDYIMLMVKYWKMQKLGDTIDREVKPLHFIGYIVSQPKLKVALQRIRNSKLKWFKFSEGFAEKMNMHYSRSDVHQLLPPFCDFLDIPTTELVKLADQRDWKKFIKVLIQ